MFNSIVEAIAYHAEYAGDKTAVIVNLINVSYRELWQKIQQYTYLLSEKGMQRGSKVVLAMDYTEQFIEIYFAVHLLGAIDVVVERTASLKSISRLMEDISPQLIILNHTEKGANSYDEFSPTGSVISDGFPASDYLADILYTTGTTGEPKGVMLSHRNEVAGALNVINGGDMLQGDRNLLTMPLHHAFGLTTLRAVLYKGGTAVLQDGVASLKKLNENIRKNHCNCIYMVPSALRILYVQTRERLDLLLGDVDKIEFCTAPLDKKIRLVLAEQLDGVRLYNSYGATEAARSVYMRLDKDTDKLDAIGQAVEGVSINIVDDDHKMIASSKQNIGHLAICGDMNMVGYYNDSNMTKTVLTEGVFYSEDLGYMDEDGYIYLAGRNNDVLNIGGEKVSPFEIENAALGYTGVRECACIGVKDAEGILGYIPVLYVAEEVGHKVDVNNLQEYLGKCLEHFKIPHEIIIIDEIPKNHIGKINRKALRLIYG